LLKLCHPLQTAAGATQSDLFQTKEKHAAVQSLNQSASHVFVHRPLVA
jgi:hypothetical protein